ncbi:MAG: hypothetical protein JWO72_337 [Caulobacteraceae bacterium]|jgi:hypothetical protein|nr:hypothetical protein [Caulobacteraceae bacterium]
MKTLLLGGALAAVLAGLAGAASAAPTEPKHAQASCFRSADWAGWHAPDDKTLYLRVNLHDIYRVDLSYGSSMLKWPDSHLVSVMHGSDYICSPLDLQLSVAQNGGGMRDYLMAKSITKLTPDQVAAIPKKDLP